PSSAASWEITSGEGSLADVADELAALGGVGERGTGAACAARAGTVALRLAGGVAEVGGDARLARRIAGAARGDAARPRVVGAGHPDHHLVLVGDRRAARLHRAVGLPTAVPQAVGVAARVAGAGEVLRAQPLAERHAAGVCAAALAGAVSGQAGAAHHAHVARGEGDAATVAGALGVGARRAREEAGAAAVQADADGAARAGRLGAVLSVGLGI